MTVSELMKGFKGSRAKLEGEMMNMAKLVNRKGEKGEEVIDINW
jgi:hypothetical protein